MARLLVRDRAMHEFQIDESALPFWEGRVEVLDRIPDIGEEPAEPELAESLPEESGDPKPSKAAARPAREVKE